MPGTARVAPGGSGAAASAPVLAQVANAAGAASTVAATAAEGSGAGIGFRTGGAQDIENFRENINNGKLPLPTDVTFEGVVKDYYFTTSQGNPPHRCNELFCPVYSAAVSPDPLVIAAAAEGGLSANASLEMHLAVGLDSGLNASDAQRKPLNLVILLDQSGSMGAAFNEYYYDQFGRQQQLSGEEAAATKMDVAKEVVTGILDLLRPEDKVSIVLFSTTSCVPLKLTPVSCQLGVFDELKREFERDVQATSSTNMADGYDLASKQLEDCGECVGAGLGAVENRIILITDAQPNTGDWSEEGLLSRLRENAAKGIFTTIVGVGLDFNTELVEAISKVKGANYYSVHSPGEFRRRLVQDFDYAVFPLVFDLELAVAPASLRGGNDATGWRILAVYGSPNPNDTAYAALGQNGTVTRVSTLFPSPKTDEGVKGGVILLRMGVPRGGVNAAPLALQAAYSDRTGQRRTSELTVALPEGAASGSDNGRGATYQSTGVRKAVLLARYTDLVRSWLIDEWRQLNTTDDRTILIPAPLCPVFPFDYCRSVPVESTYGVTSRPGGWCQLDRWVVPDGCVLPTPVPVVIQLNKWERQSEALGGKVPPDAKRAFEEFLPYFESEVEAIGDSSLNQEVDILKKIIAA